jgi:hypothetical protein
MKCVHVDFLPRSCSHTFLDLPEIFKEHPFFRLASIVLFMRIHELISCSCSYTHVWFLPFLVHNSEERFFPKPSSQYMQRFRFVFIPTYLSRALTSSPHADTQHNTVCSPRASKVENLRSETKLTGRICPNSHRNPPRHVFSM